MIITNTFIYVFATLIRNSYRWLHTEPRARAGSVRRWWKLEELPFVHFRWCRWSWGWRRRVPRVGRPRVDDPCVSVWVVASRRRRLPSGPFRRRASPHRDCDRYCSGRFAWSRCASSPRRAPWCVSPRQSSVTTIAWSAKAGSTWYNPSFVSRTIFLCNDSITPLSPPREGKINVTIVQLRSF